MQPFRFFSGTLSTYWRQVLTLLSGTGLAQAISLLALPILTRLYAPSEFGISAVWLAFVGVLALIVNGGYDMAIMLPRTQKEAHQLLQSSLSIALLCSLVLACIFLIGTSSIFGLFQVPELEPWGIFIPMAICLEGFINPLNIYLNRAKAYRIIARSRIARTLSYTSVALLLGYWGQDFSGLIISFMVGQGGAMLFLLYGYFKSSPPAWDHIFGSLRKNNLSAYQDFPKYSVISNALNLAARHLPYFLFPIFFVAQGEGEWINGLFNKAFQVLALPITLLSMNIGNVFYEHATQARQTDAHSLAELTRKTFRQLVLLGIPLFLPLVLLGPWLFSNVLGTEWRMAGEFARYLSPWMYLVFIASPLAWLVDVQRKLKPFLYINLAFFLARAAVLTLGSQVLSAPETLIAYGFANVVLVAIQIVYLLYIGHVRLLGSKSTHLPSS